MSTRILVLLMWTFCALTTVNIMIPNAPFWNRAIATGMLIALRSIK